MKTDFEPDGGLGELLATWKVDTRDDPDLSVKVWERIDRAGESGAWAWLGWLAGWVARPAGSIAIISAFVVLGAVLAGVESLGPPEPEVQQLAAEYVRTIDPVLMADAGHGK